jgi:transcriptional regulator GlxA family with amidase domain
MDLMLFIIGQHHGDHFGAKVANHFIRGAVRSEEQHQSAELVRVKGIHPKVRAVIEKMETHCEQPLPVAMLADEARLSMRRLETLFQRDVGVTPVRFYQGCRIQKARNMLQQTSMPVMQVALACGFASRTQFSAVYKKTYGHAPSAERKNACISNSVSKR